MTVKKRMVLLIPISVIVHITFSLSSCNDEHNPKALRALYDKEVYDSTIINHLGLYDSLKDILISNLDTICNFRDARTPVYHGSGPDSGRVTHEHRGFYMFYYNWDSSAQTYDGCISPETLPPFIYPAVKHIFETLGKDRIGGLTLWSDSAIEINLPKGFIDDNTKASVRQLLRWKRTVGNSDWPYIKDSIIAPGWTYEIAVLEHEDD
jgi:hypothetical protein